jgi:amidohydrolase
MRSYAVYIVGADENGVRHAMATPKSTATAQAKAGAKARLESAYDELVALSHRIHSAPELGFEEVKASAWLVELLSAAGFAIQVPLCELPTAFLARAGSGPLHLAICAEYDALPGIGHACGHNLIAAMAAGAGIAAAHIADDMGLTVSVIGTPAEEGGGGKILLLERGAFDGVHTAMMVHPAPADTAMPSMIAATHFETRYTGKEAHAAAFPELGINAADALTVAQVAIGLLRQHMRPTDRVHGIITEGGQAPNIVPAHTAARYIVRAQTLDQLQDIMHKVMRCFEAGALATGADLQVLGAERPYAQVEHNTELATLYQHNAEALGRSFVGLPTSASTDMGNVSLSIPTIHPTIGIDSLPAVNHQPEFTAACITPAADQALHDGALAMAWTAIDIACDQTIRDQLIASGGYVSPRDQMGVQ